MHPPISEPTGNLASLTEEPLSSGVTVNYRLSFFSMSRMVLKAIFVLVANVVALLVTAPTAAFIIEGILGGKISALMAWLLALTFHISLSVFLSFVMLIPHLNRDRALVLTSEGVSRRDTSKIIKIKWSRLLWVVNWSGDVLLCTFAGASFVPREAFVSRQEGREFVRMARELRKTRGGAWRDEWNEKVFGSSD